jgi:hypothetical protein
LSTAAIAALLWLAVLLALAFLAYSFLTAP